MKNAEICLMGWAEFAVSELRERTWETQAMFKHAPLVNAEKMRFWYNIMMLSNDAADVNESAPTTVVQRFLRDVLCSKCCGLDAYVQRAPSKVCAHHGRERERERERGWERERQRQR